MHLLTREQRTAYDYLEDIKMGGANKRWQGAFELSKILANSDSRPTEKRFSSELINAFKKAKHDDNRVRQYLALAMGRTGNAEFVQPLVDGLKGEHEANLAALIYALGMLRQKEAAPVLYPYTDHPNARVRSIAVVALGNIAEPGSKDVLRRHLGDSEPNVQWGAAVSLTQMGDGSGKSVLAQMLNPQYWSQFSEIDRNEQNNLVIMAINASAALNDVDLNRQINQIAKTHPSMKIRSVALDAINRERE